MTMLDLLDYRRRVSALYTRVRQAANPATAWAEWRAERDALFGQHPQSALDADQRNRFAGLTYFDYDPVYRVVAVLEPVACADHHMDVAEDGVVRCRCMGRVRFSLPTGEGQLSVYWIEGYGGGVFLPLRDATSGQETYGAGRYLYDTIKGADLGSTATELVLDFNFAYNPSCAYNPLWVCPLAPRDNWLTIPIRAGERSDLMMR